jgi:hypothetical protein
MLANLVNKYTKNVWLQRIVVPPFSGSNILSLLLAMLDPADEVTMLLQNVKNYSSNDTVSHPRRPQLHNPGVKSSSLIERLSGYPLS